MDNWNDHGWMSPLVPGQSVERALSELLALTLKQEICFATDLGAIIPGLDFCIDGREDQTDAEVLPTEGPRLLSRLLRQEAVHPLLRLPEVPAMHALHAAIKDLLAEGLIQAAQILSLIHI